MPNEQTMTKMSAHPLAAPDTQVDVRTVFGLDVDMKVPAFSQGSNMSRRSTRHISLIMTRRWPSLPGSDITGGS